MANEYRFMLFPEFKKKALTLSYDDGVIHDKRLLEIMSKNGIKGTFNINSGNFAVEEGGLRMTEKQAIELYTSHDCEVACHGVKHLSLAVVPSELAVADVINDRINLENLFGKVTRGMAYANGSYNDDVVEILDKCGIAYSRTCITTEAFDIPTDWLRLPTTCHHKNPRLFELLDTFLEDKTSGYFWSNANAPKLFYLWGHSYEFNDDDNWEVIQEFCQKAGNRDDIWYATNIEIYDYVKAFDGLKFSANGKFVFNPSCIDVCLDWYGVKVVAKAGQTTTLQV